LASWLAAATQLFTSPGLIARPAFGLPKPHDVVKELSYSGVPPYMVRLTYFIGYPAVLVIWQPQKPPKIRKNTPNNSLMINYEIL
jgi:hypothetical protein